MSRSTGTTTLLALAAACNSSGPDAHQPEATLQGGARVGAADVRPASRLPTFAVRGLESRTVLEVPPEEMRAVLANTYRVPPDRRILGAVAEADHLLSGRAPDTVTASFHDGKWTIDYAGDRVGELPDLPSLDDGTKLLVDWGRRLIQRHALDSGPAMPDEVSRARRLVSQPKPVNILAGLRSVDRAWENGRRREWLVPAAEGLVLLALQVPRGEVVGDPIVARALAALALAHASGAGEPLTRSHSLLAEYMGYGGEARRLAAGLPSDDPARLYVERDTVGLRVSSEPIARFLYLAELARGGGGDAWRLWYDRITSRDPAAHDHDDENEHDHGRPFEVGLVTSGVLGRGLEFGRFRSNASVVPQVPAQLGIELRVVGARNGRPLKNVDRWQDLLTEPLEGLGLLQYFRTARITAWLEKRSTERRRRALQQFDDDVAVVASSFDGRFVDASIAGSYFRAQMHYAFERACIHRFAGVQSAGDASVLAGAFSSVRDPLWAESSRWCIQLARHLMEDAVTQQLVATIRESTSMSDPALDYLLDVVDGRFTFNGSLELDVARAVFARLDSRPMGLYRTGVVAGTMLKDLPLIERYYDRVTELAPGDHGHLEVWYSFYKNDIPALARVADNTRLQHRTRVEALRRMLARGADSAAVFARAEALAVTQGCPWQVRDDIVWEILEPAGRFADAARVLQTWLDAHPEADGHSRLFAIIGVARQYQSMGRLDEAWLTLPQWVRSCHLAPGKGRKCPLPLGVLQRAALIALDRGDIQTARQFARYLRRDYGEAPHARLTLAEIEWKTGDDASAAQILAGHPLSEDAWHDVIAPGFLRVVGTRPVDEARRAFVSMISADIDSRRLPIIPRAAWRRGQYELAAALGKELARVWDPRLANPRVYGYIKIAHGDSAAFSWIARRWPPPQGLIPAADAYRAGEFDLLWTIATQPDSGPDGSFLWLMRALGELQQPAPRSERRRALLEHYRGVDQGAYNVAGRYLMGLESEEKIIALASTPKRRVEYSYYLGIKALSEGRYRDASDWLHVTVETRQTRDGEFIWAKELLADWWRTERPLPVAAKQLILSPLQ